MSFGFGISDFEYVFSLVLRVKNFLGDVADAPKAWNALKAEAECLSICLKVIRYKQSRRLLREISRRQRDDLLAIVKGCEINMAELIGFVAQTQSIAVAEYEQDGGKRKPSGVSLTRWMKELAAIGRNLWTRMTFIWQEKQPMREKLAIPTQSLNIYLVSLTYISLSYNTRLSGGPGGTALPPAWTEEWDVVGKKVAFKDVGFSLKDLMKPGVEDVIVDYASKKITGGGEKGKAKKPDSSGGAVKVPKTPRRKSSLGPRAGHTDSDGMFLVRRKAQARSRSRVSSGVEIVTADYDFDSDSGSSSVGFAGGYLSPRGGDDGVSYEERSPRQDTSERRGRRNAPRDHGTLEDSDEDFEGEKAAMLNAQYRGYINARAQIKRDRKTAIKEMERAVKEEAEESSYHGRTAHIRSAPPGQPDVRSYMESRYHIVIGVATPAAEALNKAEIRSRTSSYVGKPPQSERDQESKLKEGLDEPRHRTQAGQHLSDSDISSDPDSDSEQPVKLTLGPGSRMRKEKAKTEYTMHRAQLFSIPRTEYVPQTYAHEGRTSAAADRGREHFLHQQENFITRREADLERREAILQQREMDLLARERALHRRDPSTGPRNSSYESEYGPRNPSHESEYGPRNPSYESEYGGPSIKLFRAPDPADREERMPHEGMEFIRPERPGPSWVRKRGSHPRPSYSEHFSDSENEIKHEPQRSDARYSEQDIRRRNPRGSDDDDDSQEFIVYGRR
ncbi:uncharacterized protein PV07_06213 [Cladophialophora immunda]|uniref:Uncharacterized protein n=1 Tax=Cladophialophora immunda TaxID=569365 RepID=A0A0D1ZR44_9EURO|nr:uncharacterized protein PV07_06213 [Cladophialophora immunda]KIW30471.1 hypothetical protein PV07_06213 [Cladophialophora immunda]OQU97053.1 hypothetical protein CLAIMM_03056 [Cladophialophora immunda]